MKKYLAILSLTVLLVSVAGGRAHASGVPAKVITVSPATSKPVIRPGQAVHGRMQVINQGDTTYSVTVYAAPYGVHGEDYTPDFTSVPNKPDVASWMHFDIAQASIAKGKTLNIGYDISVPKGTEPGGYYAVAFAQSKSDKKQLGVTVNERVGEVFYIQVAGKVHKAGKIVSWSVPMLQSTKIEANLRLGNEGGVHYGSNTHLYVKDIFGSTKYGLLTDKEVLPQTIRHIPFVWEHAPSFGLFKVTGWTHLPSGDVQLPSKLVLVMAMPVRIIAVVIVILVAALGATKMLMTKRRDFKRAQVQAREQAQKSSKKKRQGKK